MSMSSPSVSADNLVIYMKDGFVKKIPLEKIAKIEFSKKTKVNFNQITFSNGYHVKEFPINNNFPYIAEFEFYDDLTIHFFAAGFRKEGGPGKHRDLEIQIDPKVNNTRYIISKYTGVIGRSDNEFPQKRIKGWRKMKLILQHNGYKVFLDGDLVSQGTFTFIPDKIWFRSGIGYDIPQIGGHNYNGKNIVKYYH